MSTTSVTASAIMNTVNADFTLQSYVTELNGLSALLEGIMRVKVLATIILDYSGIDGRQRVSFFLDRKLSPSPSFVLSYEPTIWGIIDLFNLAVNNANQVGGIQRKITEDSITIMLCDREIVKIENMQIFSDSNKRAAEQALPILRREETCFKYLCFSMNYLQKLKRRPLSIDFENDIKAAQIRGIEGDSKNRAKAFFLSRSNCKKVLPFRLLSCQKKPFDLQLDVQKTAEEVICHLKLNGLPLSETSNPGQGRIEEEAIDSALEKSNQYLIEMTNALTYREFRIIETELLRRSVLAVTHNPMNANILQQNCSVNLM